MEENLLAELELTPGEFCGEVAQEGEAEADFIEEDRGKVEVGVRRCVGLWGWGLLLPFRLPSKGGFLPPLPPSTESFARPCLLWLQGARPSEKQPWLFLLETQYIGGFPGMPWNTGKSYSYWSPHSAVFLLVFTWSHYMRWILNESRKSNRFVFARSLLLSITLWRNNIFMIPTPEYIEITPWDIIHLGKK